MTIIAALRENDKVYVGGDSAAVCPQTFGLTLRKDPKVFKVGLFTIGFTTSFRMGQILRFGDSKLGLASFKKSNMKGMAPFNFMVRHFVPITRAILVSGGFGKKNDEGEDFGEFIVAFGKNIFVISSDLQVGESMNDYEAVGCAGEMAKGALDTLTKFPQLKMSPQDKIRSAMETCEKNSAGVRGPFIILEA